VTKDGRGYKRSFSRNMGDPDCSMPIGGMQRVGWLCPEVRCGMDEAARLVGLPVVIGDCDK